MKNHRLIGPNDVCTTKASTRSLSRINHFRKQKIIICIRFFWWNSFFLKPQSVFLLLFHFIITELFWGKNRWYISLFHYQARKARSSDLRLLRNKLLSEPVKVVHDFGFTFLRTLSSVSHFLFLSVSVQKTSSVLEAAEFSTIVLSPHILQNIWTKFYCTYWPIGFS